MRLAGATPGQAILIAAGETAASALLGSLLGLGVYAVLRSALDRPGPDGRLPLPTDVVLAPWSVALILLLVPVLAGLVGTLLLRKVIITPLGVVRRIRDRKPSILPGVLILTGIFVPFVVKPIGFWIWRRFNHHHQVAPNLVLIGVALIVIAAIWAAPGADFWAVRPGRARRGPRR